MNKILLLALMGGGAWWWYTRARKDYKSKITTLITSAVNATWAEVKQTALTPEQAAQMQQQIAVAVDSVVQKINKRATEENLAKVIELMPVPADLKENIFSSASMRANLVGLSGCPGCVGDYGSDPSDASASAQYGYPV